MSNSKHSNQSGHQKSTPWGNRSESRRQPPPPPNHDLGDQLERVSKDIVVRSSLSGERRVFRNPDDWIEDGVDHINIDSRAATELGRMLAQDYPLRWRHPIFEDFMSLDAFWSYIRSVERDDKLRHLVGRELSNYAKTLHNRPMRHLKAIIIHAQYERIRYSAKLHKLMMANELPFDIYRVTQVGLKVRAKTYDWMIEGHMALQRAIQQGIDPNLGFLCDCQTDDVYESVRPKLPKHLQKPTAEERAVAAAKQKQEVKTPAAKAAKVRTRVMTFEPGFGCQLIPAVSQRTAQHDEWAYLVDSHRSVVVINGVSIETAPYRAGVTIPLLTISDNAELENSKVLSVDDIVRVGTFNKNLFVGDRSHELARIDSVIINTNQEDLADPGAAILIPVWLKLVNRTIDKEGDVQTVTVDENSTVIHREVSLIRPIMEFTGTNGKPLGFLDVTIASLKSANEKSVVPVVLTKELKWAIIEVAFDYKYSYITDPSMNFDGEVVLLGFSSGPSTDAERESLYLPEPAVFPIRGFNTTMYRGVQLPEVIEEVPVVATTEEQPTSEDSVVSEAVVDLAPAEELVAGDFGSVDIQPVEGTSTDSEAQAT